MTKADEANSPPAKYCRTCFYPLKGLRGNRCPECGALFDPDDPESYALTSRRPWVSREGIRRALRASIIVTAVVLFLTLAETSVNIGSSFETCAYCGAQSHVRHFYFFGIGEEYGRKITEGPLSRFIQEQDGVPCPHQWRMCHSSGGFLLARRHGRGPGSVDAVWIDAFGSNATALLRTGAATDPSFVKDLKKALAYQDYDFSKAFFRKLASNLSEWRGRPPPRTRRPTPSSSPAAR
jgi:hypothetical protein